MREKCIYLASVFYSWCVRARTKYFDWLTSQVYRAPVPVISVGSLSAGGAGKSPLCVFLASLFNQHGWNVYLVSHSYKSWLKNTVTVEDIKEAKMFVPDEAALQAFYLAPLHIKVLAGPSKRAALKSVPFLEKTVVIMDDAYISYYIYRNADIVILNGKDYSDVERLKPRCLHRVIPSFLRGDEILVLRNFEKIPALISQRFPHTSIFLVDEKQVFYNWRLERVSPSEIQGTDVVVACGIAHPYRFIKGMEKYFKIKKSIIVGDHGVFQKKHLNEMVRALNQGDASYVVITLKDRLRYGSDTWPRDVKEKTIVVDIQLSISDEEEFFKILLQRITQDDSPRS